MKKVYCWVKFDWEIQKYIDFMQVLISCQYLNLLLRPERATACRVSFGSFSCDMPKSRWRNLGFQSCTVMDSSGGSSKNLFQTRPTIFSDTDGRSHSLNSLNCFVPTLSLHCSWCLLANYLTNRRCTVFLFDCVWAYSTKQNTFSFAVNDISIHEKKKKRWNIKHGISGYVLHMDLKLEISFKRELVKFLRYQMISIFLKNTVLFYTW